MKHVVISLLNFNSKKNTLDCLESLKNIKKDGFKLTVVVGDNASTDGSPSIISSFQPSIFNFKVILNKQNLGFSEGHNAIIRYALENRADYVLILNNDTYVDKNFLTTLLRETEGNSDVGIVVPKIYFAPGFEFHKDRYSKAEIGKIIWYAGGEMDWSNVIGRHRGVDEVDKGQYDKTQEVKLATGCCMLVRKEVFEKIGNFDGRYFLYYEDADLSMRARKKGFKIIYVPKSVIWHKNAGSAGGSGSILQDYFITRNRLLFGFKFASIHAKFALFKESLSLLFKGRQWQRHGVKDFYLKKFRKGSYNI